MQAQGPGRTPRHGDGGTTTQVAPKIATKRKLQRPRLYKVILLNDDFTTQEFVDLLLQHVFHHSEASAHAIMLNIHRTGAGIAGIYTHEVAETKVQQVIELAQQNEYPLQCTMEPDDDGKREDE
ncbi:MAG: ATP-dependent Clp protease adaptor ClpS [Polyangia bacterium]